MKKSIEKIKLSAKDYDCRKIKEDILKYLGKDALNYLNTKTSDGIHNYYEYLKNNTVYVIDQINLCEGDFSLELILSSQEKSSAKLKKEIDSFVNVHMRKK